jgi:hypothetical protein
VKKLPTQLRIGREDQTSALRQPGMNRMSTVRMLKSNLGKATASEKRPIGGKPKGGGLSQHTAPQKHEASALSTTKFGFGGPGSTMPV